MDSYGGYPLWWQWFLPRYGNWGCPGWSAGRWNNGNTDTDWSVSGVDGIDTLFKHHDWGYQHSLDLDKEDAQLVKMLRLLSPESAYGKLYRIIAMAAFTLWPVIRRLVK